MKKQLTGFLQIFLRNPIKDLAKKERWLWIGSLFVVIVSNLVSGDVDYLTLAAASIGVTSLIFAARGCLGTDSDDCIQHPLQYDFPPLPLLG